MGNAAKLGAIALFWLAVGLVQTFNWGGGFPKAFVLLLLLLALPWTIARAQAQPAPLSPPWQRGLAIALGLGVVLDALYLALRLAHPHLIDIATTTLAAGNALLHGGNPYALPIDTGPEAAGFDGYKYLPVMIAAYLPLGALLGERGVLLTNAIVLALCLWLMRRLARSTLAPVLFLMLPLVSEQLFAKGATDLITVLPLLASFAVAERSSFLAGLGVGLSIAAKPVPGGLFLPCLLPARRRARYAAGIVVGLLPLLPFLVISPHRFLANTLLFALRRPADSTSWMGSAPPSVALVAHGAMIAAFVIAFVYCWRRAPSLAMRSGLGAMLTIAAILAGPGAHHNYQLWWLPFAALTLSLALARGEACQESGLRYTSAVGLDARGP